MHKTPIGTLVDALIPDPVGYMIDLIPDGYECFQLTFWQNIGTTDLERLAHEIRSRLDPLGIPITTVGVYGNPLESDEEAEKTRESLRAVVQAAPLFGAPIVSCFTGRIRNAPIPESIPAYQKFFGPLADSALKSGTRLALENCAMGGTWRHGDWNMAHGPDAWELIFDALPHPNIGLEWETCHQMVNLIDPIAQLPHWIDRVFHVHGKCANVYPDVIKVHGIHGAKAMADHRFPGLGDADWTDVFRILNTHNYKGTIDIEGWHDPVFKDESELEGQCNALTYLKACRDKAYKTDTR
jgi:sugar phosphate isomerase/epimerase